MKSITEYLRAAPILLLFALLLFCTGTAVPAAEAGLKLCAERVVPSLFPLSVLTNLLLLWLPSEKGNGAERPSCALPLLLALMGGYPLGAQTVSRLYQQGALSRSDAVRLARFSNQAGPAFLLGAVGLRQFQSVRFGLLLWVVQLASAGLTAFCFGLRRENAPIKNQLLRSVAMPFSRSLSEAVRRSTGSMLQVCGLVVVFTTLLAVLRSLPLLCVIPKPVWAVLAGGLELTGGLALLPETLRSAALPLCAILCVWGGLCVHFQSLCFFADAKLPFGSYLVGKLVQTTVALPLSCLLAGVFGLADYGTVFPVSGIVVMILVFFIFFRFLTGNRVKTLL